MLTLRVLHDPPAAGTWNMAVDEALLASAAESGIATLRFYTWSQPTLSLGYFQAAAERATHAASQTCPLVRRASGGGAIVHDQELTYSIALPLRDARGPEARQLYNLCHASLVQTLAELGASAMIYRGDAAAACDAASAAEPFLCFQRRSCGDILCGPAKIVGSAQRRRRAAVLQHGSVLLRQSPCAPELPGIDELTGKQFDPAAVASRWQSRLLAALPAQAAPGELSPREREQARILEIDRFQGSGFTRRR
jgi:lipoate-protein ligase A